MPSALEAPIVGGEVTAPSLRRVLAPLWGQEEAEGAGDRWRGGEPGPERGTRGHGDDPARMAEQRLGSGREEPVGTVIGDRGRGETGRDSK